jgi:hypothetical protein
MTWLRAGVLLASLLAAAPAWAGAPRLEYIYADANEGGASGGHAGLRFGDQVFHFEYVSPLVQMRRDAFDALRFRYTILDNRSISLHRLAVTPETYQHLLDAFTERYFDQEHRLATQRGLTADRRLLETLLVRRRGQAGELPFAVEAAGYFFETARLDAPPPAGEGSSALADLHARVAEAHGAGFIVGLEASVTEELLTLDPAREGLADRYRHGLSALLALDVLRHARPLRPALLVHEGPVLDEADLGMLDPLVRALEASLVRLVRSSRPDWGFPLLVGMARLAALEESRRLGRWVFLDVFPTDAAVVSVEAVRRRAQATGALLDEARRDFMAARVRLVPRAESDGLFPELAFATLEQAGNRLIEIAGALDGTRAMRLPFGLGVPARRARVDDLPDPLAASDALARALEQARAREDAHAAQLEARDGYNVVTRNCVTEIFRTIEAGLLTAEPPGTTAREASERRLGGYVTVDGTLNFIPATSSESVKAAYTVAENAEIPSYRLAALAAMYRRDNRVQVYVRESNTLTSTLYVPHPEDSAFLFFTDDALPVRPLLGAANLVTGLGVTAVGLFTVAADHGATLRAGLRGMLFSLPELVFFNIRKGSLLYAPRPASGPTDP